MFLLNYGSGSTMEYDSIFVWFMIAGHAQGQSQVVGTLSCCDLHGIFLSIEYFDIS